MSDKIEAIRDLCRNHSVKSPELFGSMARDSFVPGRSDVDLLVKFAPCTPEEHANRYFGLLSALQDLFGCDVDLIEDGAVRNPYFRREIDAHRQVMYAD